MNNISIGSKARPHYLQVRLSDEEQALLNELKEKTGLTGASVFRSVLYDHKSTKQLSA